MRRGGQRPGIGRILQLRAAQRDVTQIDRERQEGEQEDHHHGRENQNGAAAITLSSTQCAPTHGMTSTFGNRPDLSGIGAAPHR